MDELQPLISLFLLPLFPLCVAKCIIQLPRVREQREDVSVTVRERERETVASLVMSAHTNTAREDTSSV